MAFLVISGGALYAGLPLAEAISLGTTALAVGVGLGLFQAADTQMVEKVGPDILPVIAKVEKDLMEKHAVNAQNIAVHAAVLSVPLAAPPVVQTLEPAEEKTHLVS